jgi:hypothetical protein
VAIVWGERGIGAAGLGWDVPLSYIRRDLTFAHRPPKGLSGAAPEPRERVTLVLGGQSHELVRTASGWGARRDAPEMDVREQLDGTWVMYDGQGRTYTFTTVSSSLAGANLWLLKTIAGVGGSSVPAHEGGKDERRREPPRPGVHLRSAPQPADRYQWGHRARDQHDTQLLDHGSRPDLPGHLRNR